LLLVIAWVGCGDDVTPAEVGAGGSAQGGDMSSPMAATTSTGGGNTGTCDGPADDYCDPDNGEECDCSDCTDTGYCVDGACDAEDGECHYLADLCVCPDCDIDSYCSDPSDGNCTNDGTCENYDEGCACEDCYADPKCTDNSAACDGGAPDDVCGATEDCICPDCAGTVRCVPCQDDSECGLIESCLCADCLTNEFCLDTAANCVVDGTCAPLYEGCGCADCSAESQCGGGGAGGN
jgi:hypothetical protein